MAAKVPTVRQTNWVSIIPHLFVMGLIIVIWHSINPEKAILFEALTYLLISISLRKFIPKDHIIGIKNNNSENFEKAIKNFKKSYAFFKKYDWVDKYRFITLLSSSKITYKKMALVNIAFCYGQLGNGEQAKAYYERVLNEFPESMIAKTALRFLNSI